MYYMYESYSKHLSFKLRNLNLDILRNFSSAIQRYKHYFHLRGMLLRRAERPTTGSPVVYLSIPTTSSWDSGPFLVSISRFMGLDHLLVPAWNTVRACGFWRKLLSQPKVPLEVPWETTHSHYTTRISCTCNTHIHPSIHSVCLFSCWLWIQHSQLLLVNKIYFKKKKKKRTKLLLFVADVGDSKTNRKRKSLPLSTGRNVH